MIRELVYGRRPVREALRGRRDVLELWVTERALTGASGTTDHQGVLAYCEPYRYADGFELASQALPTLVCLDRVTDPHNLGAVCRSVEGAGATGIVLPAHGSARVTPAVCRASAGAVEHVAVG